MSDSSPNTQGNIKLKLGDIILINSPNDPNLDQKKFLIKYLSNKKIISIPYNDIERWGHYNNRWSFRWKLTTETVIYKNSKKFENYFKRNDRCIVYVTPRGKNDVNILNNTMNKYKSKFYEKAYVYNF